ncbi:hypothetical protein D3C78_1537210 [compost metagenome]
MRDLGDAVTDFRVHPGGVNAPGGGELGAYRGVGDRLITWELIGQHAHITGTLNVVLPTHRANPHVGPAQITGQQGQTGEPFDHVDRLAELGDSHAPHDGGGRGTGVGAHRLANLLGADAGQLFYRFRCVIR